MSGKPEFVKWVERYKVARRRWGQFVWDESIGPGTNATKVVIMKRVAGDWPDNSALVTLADGDDPRYPNHFGGRVVPLIHSDKKTVEVYVD